MEEHEREIVTNRDNSRKLVRVQGISVALNDDSVIRTRKKKTESRMNIEKKKKKRKGMINTKDSRISETRNSQRKTRLNG